MSDITDAKALDPAAASSAKPAAAHKDIPSLDGIRAIAVLLVFVAHAGLGHIVPGGFGVTVFFFLSGYLITTLFVREQEKHGSIDLGAFFLRRLTRLSPPLFITLIIVYALTALSIVHGEMNIGAAASQFFYFANYYVLSYGPRIPDGTDVLWSLAVEEHFYLVYPFLFIALSKIASPANRVALLAALALVILLWRFFLYFELHASNTHLMYATDARLDSILYGCLLAALNWGGYSERAAPRSTIGVALVTAACLAALIISFLWRDEAFRQTLRYSIQGLALIPLFYFAVKLPEAPQHRLLNTKPMMLIGTYSYTIYLIHFVIIGVLHQIPAMRSSFLLTFSAAFVIAFLYSAVMYRFVEAPMGRFRQRLRGHGK